MRFSTKEGKSKGKGKGAKIGETGGTGTAN